MSAAVVVWHSTGVSSSRTWLINPGVPIPPEATLKHGITDEQLEQDGRAPSEAIAEIVEELQRHVDAGHALVAYNARYDFTLLDREARRYGLPPLDRAQVVDPYVMDKHLDRYRRGPRHLEDLARRHRVRLDNAHTSEADAIAAAHVAVLQGRLGRISLSPRSAAEERELSTMQAEWAHVRADLARLHEAQIRWAAGQAASLEQYFRSRGRRERCERAWPVVPAPGLALSHQAVAAPPTRSSPNELPGATSPAIPRRSPAARPRRRRPLLLPTMVWVWIGWLAMAIDLGGNYPKHMPQGWAAVLSLWLLAALGFTGARGVSWLRRRAAS